jgi:flagellar biosynthetic protein FliR
MTVSLDLGWLAAVVLLSVRVAGATALTAVLGPTALPGSVRVLIAASLGLILATTMGVSAVPMGSIVQFAVACVDELLIGGALAGGFIAANAATQVAGRVLDTQMGFGVASIFNPAVGAVSPLTGTILGMAAVSVFLAANGHHMLIRALALSVQTMPPGAPLQAFNWNALIAQFGVMFVYGLALAAPVMFALLFADAALAVFARSMPQLNIFVLGFAIKIMLGLVGLAVSVRLAGPVFNALFRATYRYWEGLAAGP